MRTRQLTRSGWLVTFVAMLAGTSFGQNPRQPNVRHERVKVPAVAHASYSAPEAAPRFNEPKQKVAAAPRPQRRSNNVHFAAFEEPIPQSGEMMMEEVGPGVQQFDGPPGAPGCGGGDCGSDCGDDCCTDCCPDPCCTIWENLQVFGGVQGFKSPVDQGVNGNFGFHEGANWGGPVFEYGGMGGQIGAQVVQSDLAESFLFDDNRIQFFFTTGLFHRPFDNNGWQGGVVFDWLHDDYYVQMDVTQIRGEISWLSCGHHEIGFWTALATTSDQAFSSINDANVGWEPIDMYALFYRKYFDNGAIGRFSAGFTGDGEGLLGVDGLAPITQHCAVVASANYIMGRNDPAPEEALTESWGLTLSVVWFPGYKSPCSSRNPYRPIFDVVGNTTMMLKYRGPQFGD